MSIAALLLGKTNVALFHAIDAPQEATGGIAGATMGVVEAVSDLLGVDTGEPPALFTVDVSVAESHQRQAVLTDHPVEASPDITDHVRLTPDQLTINGLMTDTPSGLLALAVVPGLINRFTGEPRSIESFRKLDDLRRARVLLDVVTALTVYKNMIITSIIVPRRARFGRGLEFTIKLRELFIVTSETRAAGSLDGGASDIDVGAQVPIGVP